MLEIEKIIIDNTNSNAGIIVVLNNPQTGEVKMEVRFSDGVDLEKVVLDLENMLKEICINKFEQLGKLNLELVDEK